jgi:uncharacterized protein (DUF488 family)
MTGTGGRPRRPRAERTLPFGKEVPALAQAASEMAWNLPRLAALVDAGKRSFDFVSAGTSGKTPDVLLSRAELGVFRVGAVVDIRATPFSRHTPQWNRSALEPLVRAAGLEYVPRPDLGVPPDVRNRLRREGRNYGDLFTWYDASLGSEERLASLDPLRSRHPLLLCTELGPTFCHRHRLALRLEDRWRAVSFDL